MGVMKKVFMVFGGVFLLVILVIVGTGLSMWYKSYQYEDTAVPYLTATIPELSKWDAERIKKLVAPEILEETTPEQFNKIIKHLSALGILVTMGEPRIAKVYQNATNKSGEQTLVKYHIDAVYENGNAVIAITLLDLDDSFQVYKLHIDSMALVEPGFAGKNPFLDR
jgi:hypothetical protein